MKQLRIALVGLGNVGRHFVQLFANKRQHLRDELGLNVTLVAVVELKGTVIDSEGIAPESLLELPRGVDGILSHSRVQRGFTGPDAIAATGAQVLVESTPTNLETGEPGVTNLRAALNSGMHVVTLAKGPLVIDWPGITGLAASKGLQVKFSGATAAALPTIDVAQYCLAGMEVTEIRGILNGTTNYILTRMHRAGIDYETGLSEAQELGVAEPNPRYDVEGFDTAAKTLILANAVMKAGLQLDDVAITGITAITPDQVAKAAAAGKVIKLLGSAERGADGRVAVRIEPVELDGSHPLAGVGETNKAVYFDTVEMGPLMVTGGRSDPRGAAAAALKDIVNLAREIR